MSDLAVGWGPRRLLGRRYLFSIGGRAVPAYPAMLYLGCVSGVFAGAAAAGRTGVDRTHVASAMIVLLVPAFVGARLLFVLQHVEMFRADHGRIWRRSDGGSALYGGLLLSTGMSVPLLAAWDIPFWGFWDAASVTMLVGLIFTRFGCLLHGCCAGRATSGRLGVWLPDHAGVWKRRWPTPLLEAAWASLILAYVQASHGSHVAGDRYATVVAAYAAGRLVLETTREGDGARLGRTSNLALSAALLAAAGAVVVIR